MNPAISIVIRAYNEAAELERLFANISKQDLPADQIELIVVDNGSKDATAEVARKHGAKIVNLAQEEFSYPKSSNLGVAAASAPIICMLSSHAWLWRRDGLCSALRHFSDENVAGVYGPGIAIFQSSPIEKTSLPLYWLHRLKGPRKINKERLGILGATNCMLRKSLWDQHPFDERYGAGGEDSAWAGWALGKGLSIIFEPRFAIHHSHKLSIRGYISQQKLWRSLQEAPRPFNRKELGFRNDIRDE